MPVYFAFGLTIQSDLEFPELLSAVQLVEHFDVTIKSAQISLDGLVAPEKKGLHSQTAPGQFWMHVPDIAWYEVTSGNQIRYQLEAGADQQSMRLYLLGSCMGALLHQRKLLVMHGNAIRFGDQCVMFAGPSGNGKSTLAAAFYQRGFDILSDDVCAIDNRHQVIPGYPQLKLWRDTAKKLGIDVSAMRQIRLQIEKYALRIDNQYYRDPLPLVATYFLSTHNIDEFEFEDVSGMDTFMPLKNNTYRPSYLEGMGLKPGHLLRCGSLSGKATVTRVTRPNTGFRLDDMVDAILVNLAEKGIRA